MPGGNAETDPSSIAKEDSVNVGAEAHDVAEMAHEVTAQGSPDDELPPEQALCVRMVLEGKSQQEIADEIGYSRRQVIRWMARKQVRDAIRQGAQEGLSRARMVLATNAVFAASALLSMAGGQEAADPARTAAARSVIELATKLGEYAGDAAATKQDIHVSGGMTVAQMNSEQRAKRRAELDEKVRKAKEQAARGTAGAPRDDGGDDPA